MPSPGQLLSRFFRHLLPGACLLCDQALPGGAELDLCSFCMAALPWNHPACARCAQPLLAQPLLAQPLLAQPLLAQPLAATHHGGEVCEQCQRRPPPYTHALAPLRYEGWVQTWVRRLKDHLGIVEGRVLGMLMAEAAAREYRLPGTEPHQSSERPIAPATLAAAAPPRRPDLIVPVPLSRSRLARRGHNQALTLALPVARRLEIPVLRRAVVRRRSGGYQRGRSRAERLEAATGVFANRIDWRDHAPCVAIVDDVLTTGTTVAALCRILLAAGASEVHVIAAARTPRRSPGPSAASRGRY
jgi:predicted amidophosphoribosyltransferase